MYKEDYKRGLLTSNLIKESIDKQGVYGVYITHEQLKRYIRKAINGCRRNYMKILQNSSIPIYRQIADQLKEEILTGVRKQGEFLPSIRGLAKDLRISVITTMKAYEELERQGLVTAQQGKGYYVNEQNSEMLREQHLRKMEQHLLDAITAARIAGVSELELTESLMLLLKNDY